MVMNDGDKLRSERIVEWLKKHDLIKRNALCKLVGYRDECLGKVMKKSGTYQFIPAGYLDGIEIVLGE